MAWLVHEPRKIVVAVDESAHSRKALSWCVQNSLHRNDELHVVTVLPPLTYSVYPVAPVATAASVAAVTHQWEVQKKLDEARAASILRDAVDICIEKHEVPREQIHTSALPAVGGASGVGESVVEYAKLIQADLIVVGSRGMGTFKRSVMSLVGLGSVSDYCIHQLESPVLVVHAEPHDQQQHPPAGKKSPRERSPVREGSDGLHQVGHPASVRIHPASGKEDLDEEGELRSPHSPHHFVTDASMDKLRIRLSENSAGSLPSIAEDDALQVDAVKEEERIERLRGLTEEDLQPASTGVESLRSRKARGPLSICIATDDSKNSKVALQWALTDMVLPGDQLHLVVVALPVPFPVLDEGSAAVASLETQQWRSRTEEALAYADQARRQAVQVAVSHGVDEINITSRTLTPEGGASDVGASICRYVQEHKVDLLVLGSRGMGSLKRSLMGLLGLGSVSDYCAHHVQCAVAVVKSLSTEPGPTEEEQREAEGQITENRKTV